MGKEGFQSNTTSPPGHILHSGSAIKYLVRLEIFKLEKLKKIFLLEKKIKLLDMKIFSQATLKQEVKVGTEKIVSYLGQRDFRTNIYN